MRDSIFGFKHRVYNTCKYTISNMWNVRINTNNINNKKGLKKRAKTDITKIVGGESLKNNIHYFSPHPVYVSFQSL